MGMGVQLELRSGLNILSEIPPLAAADAPPLLI